MYKNKQIKYCAYCSSKLDKSNKTSDHVFAKTLYPLPYSHNFITVPACQECNNYYSKYEEYFKHVTVIDEKVHQQQEFKKLGTEVAKSIKKHQKFYKNFIGGIQQIDLVTSSNIYLGKRLGVKIDSTILDTVLKKMIKGLYYNHEKKS